MAPDPKKGRGSPVHRLTAKKIRRLTGELWRLLSDHKGSIALLAGLVSVQAGLNVGGAAALKHLMDGFQSQSAREVYLAVPLAVAGVLITLAFLNYGVSLLANVTGERIVSHLREDSFYRLLGLPQAFFDSAHSASLSSRLINDLGWVRQAVRHLYREGFSEPAVLLTLGGYLLYLNPGLFALSLGILPPFALPVWWLGRRASRFTKELLDGHARRAAVQQESFAGAAVIRATGTRQTFATRFAKTNQSVLKTWTGLYKTSGLIHPVGMTLAGLAFAGVSVLGYRQLESGDLSVGTYAAFLGGLVLFFRASSRLGRQISSFLETLGALERIIDLREEAVAEEFKLRSKIRKLSTPSVDAGVGVHARGVSFYYGEEGPKVLENVHLEAAPGEVVAVLGPSGCGKSTLLKILLGFYAPTQGTVLLGGLDPMGLPPERISELVGYLDQEAVLLDDTIRFNICLGRETTDQEIGHTLALAHLEAFVQSLPQRLETRVGESGHRLSAGQRRRVALARCLLCAPPVLLLDEPTSSLDDETQKEVVATILSLARAGHTVLVATHLHDTARPAQRTLKLPAPR